MKRSEMIVLIGQLVKSAFKEVEKRPDIDEEIKEQYGEIILNACEKAGMKPPDHFVDGYDDMFDEPVKIRRRNSWEPEE